MWPWKKKTNKPIVALTAEDVAAIVKKAHTIKRVPACPERQLLAQNCVCMDCPKVASCPMEAACRSTGCETNILTCSLKTKLTKNNGSVSEFGDVVAAVSVRHLFRTFTGEEQTKLRKEMKERGYFDEGGNPNGKKEGDKGAIDCNGPSVLG